MSEKFLTKSEIDELDESIDSIVENFSLLSQTRDQALFHTLFHYILMAEMIDIKADSKSKHNNYRNLYNALNHAVQWIYKHCPSSNQNNKTFDLELLYQAQQLIDSAADYAALWATMIMLHKERARGRLVEQNSFEITLRKLENRNLDTARMMIGHSDVPESLEDSSIISSSVASYVRGKLKINYNATTEELKYWLRNDDFKRLIGHISNRKKNTWIMNPDWNLGGYTYKQLKIFWVALQGLCIMHKIAVETAFPVVNNTPKFEFFKSRIKFQTRDTWISELTEKTKLPNKIVELIINDLTQNEVLYNQKGEKKTHVMYHPFFRFSNDQLAVCERIVISANIERNAWSTMSILRPELFNQLTKEKESFWVKEFQTKAESLNLKSFYNIEFKDKNGEGQIDLLILDELLKFGLVCELKWLTSSDTASGVAYEDEYIIKGRKQAAKAIKWIKSNIGVLAEKIKYREAALKSFEFKPLVISRNAIGSGFIGKTEVPVINQDLWDWITITPRQENIQTLWNIADSLSYLPKIGEHYKYSSETITWGEMKFHFKDTNFNIIKRWTSKNDIHLPIK